MLQLRMCVDFAKRWLSSAKSHEIRCGIPRNVGNAMKVVCGFGNSCADDRLEEIVSNSAFAKIQLEENREQH